MLSLMGAIFTLIIILFLAYWSSRLLGKSWTRTSAGKHMKVIEQIQIGQDKQLLLVKLQEHTYFLGVSQAGIQLLSQVEGEFNDCEAEGGGRTDSGFEMLMKKYASLYDKRREGDK